MPGMGQTPGAPVGAPLGGAFGQQAPQQMPVQQGPVDWSARPMPPSGGGVGVGGPTAPAPQGGGGVPKFQTNSQYALGNLARPFDPLATRLVAGPAGFGGGGIKGMIDPLGAVLGRDAPKKVKGSIDPATGTVDVSNYGKYQPGLEAAYTQYLRTGEVPKQLKHGKGAFKNLKNEIRDFRATGGQGGGAWNWGTPSAGAPTNIPSTGPVNWGQPAPGAPPAGQPPVGQPPVQGQSRPQWQRPTQLPSPQAYKAQQIQALRAPNARSALTGG
jgi:hypothetical protein